LSEEFVQVLSNFLAARQETCLMGKQVTIHETNFSISQQQINANVLSAHCVVVCKHLWNLQSLTAPVHSIMLQLEWN